MQNRRRPDRKTDTLPAIRATSSIEQQIGCAKKQRAYKKKKLAMSQINESRTQKVTCNVQTLKFIAANAALGICMQRQSCSQLHFQISDLQRFMRAKQHVKSVMRESVFAY